MSQVKPDEPSHDEVRGKAGEAPDTLEGLLPTEGMIKWDKSNLKEACERGLRVGRTRQEFDLQLLMEMLMEIERLESVNTRATQWQPIETAPKMRKLIVGYFNQLGNWRTVLAQYWNEGELESETEDSGFAPEGWYEATEAYEYLMPIEQEPTFWMPLPAPPKST